MSEQNFGRKRQKSKPNGWMVVLTQVHSSKSSLTRSFLFIRFANWKQET